MTTNDQEQAAPVDWQAIARQRERELKTVGEQKHAIEQELARLREGEEPVTDPAISLSPGQWIWEWNHATPAKRLTVSADAMRDRTTASTCFFMAHEKRLKESGHAWVALARVRDVLADMERITGARHWARILRKAVDGEPSSGPAATEATEAALAACTAQLVHDQAALAAEQRLYRPRTEQWQRAITDRQQAEEHRDRLAATVRDSLPILRRALEQLPKRCRYHGDQTAPPSDMFRREACCDTGVPARRRKLAEEILAVLEPAKEQH